MGLTSEGQDTMTVASGDLVPAPKRSLVLVAGSGRSGTSLFTGILQRLGLYVPKPEVPADDTNPRGFAESQWVVDFHARLLKKARVQVSDARPVAWAQVAELGLEEEVQQELRKWLETQFREADHLIVKDPRLSWFLPLWRRSAEEVAAAPRFATVLRHPAAVIDSKQRSYGGWQGDVGRAAGWLNQALYTERATREAPRVFVRYEELLEDWPRAVARVAEALDLAVIREASGASMLKAHQFVDKALSRSRADWDDFEIPAALRAQAEQVWALLCRLSDGEDGGDVEETTDGLEAARAAYIELYDEAEAIAQSSIAAAQHRRPSRPGRAVGLARRVPKRYRRKLPLRWRVTVARALSRSASGRQ